MVHRAPPRGVSEGSPPPALLGEGIGPTSLNWATKTPMLNVRFLGLSGEILRSLCEQEQ
jgi:hypothetical protein